MAGMGMDYGSMASSAVGLGIGLIGTALGAGEADRARKEMLGVANTPGIDFAGLENEALRNYGQNFDLASGLASRVGMANQAQLLAQREMALPGASAAQAEQLGAIRGLFAEDSDWLKGVMRRGAAFGLGRGTGGSPATQIGLLQRSDMEKAQRVQLASGLMDALMRSAPIATNTPGVQAFLGLSMGERLAQRSQERAQRMSLLSGRAGMPTSQGAWGQGLQQLGGALMGAGISGGFSTNMNNSNLGGYNNFSADLGTDMPTAWPQ